MMRVPVVVAGVEFLAMVDTGATHCILTAEAARGDDRDTVVGSGRESGDCDT